MQLFSMKTCRILCIIYCKKITKINRSAGSERAWLTGAGQQAAGRSVATVNKDSGRIRSADVAVFFYVDLLMTF